MMQGGKNRIIKLVKIISYNGLGKNEIKVGNVTEKINIPAKRN